MDPMTQENAPMQAAQACRADGDLSGAAYWYQQALHSRPDDDGLRCDCALAVSMSPSMPRTVALQQAIAVLDGGGPNRPLDAKGLHLMASFHQMLWQENPKLTSHLSSAIVLLTQACAQSGARRRPRLELARCYEARAFRNADPRLSKDAGAGGRWANLALALRYEEIDRLCDALEWAGEAPILDNPSAQQAAGDLAECLAAIGDREASNGVMEQLKGADMPPDLFNQVQRCVNVAAMSVEYDEPADRPDGPSAKRAKPKSPAP